MRETEQFIFFWATSEIYSNWHPARFRMNGHTFAHSEQAMMFEKAKLMGDTQMMAKILKTTNAKKVKELGRDVKPWKQGLWEKHRLSIMIKVCYAKFSANPVLQEELLSTGNKILVEASPYDDIWGIGMKEDDPGVENPKKWQGLNLLGQALMSVRTMLRENQKQAL
jgi:ribA/ribD-fused uncharacterized protein